MEQLKHIKQSLVGCVQAQISKGLDNVNAEELGEVIDMIKDLEEAMYYCSVIEAMKEYEEDKEGKGHFMKNFSPKQYPAMLYDMEGGVNERMFYDGSSRRMYYDGRGNSNGGNNSGGNKGNSRGYTEYYPYPTEIRDYREGKSPITRRNYMESKELKHDKAKQMQELDKYVQELTEDILEMIRDATPEEKATLSQKMTTLAGKIRLD